MKKRSETYQKWIDAAYSEFAHEGPAFSLKALSEKAELPRATLYYYFESKEELIDELIIVHKGYCQLFDKDIQTKIEKLIPDLYQVLYDYKTAVLFQQQLFRNRHIDEYNTAYCCINNCSIQFLIPFIKNYFNLSNSDHEIVKFYSTLTDAWYSRINIETSNVESMSKLALSLMDNFSYILKQQ